MKTAHRVLSPHGLFVAPPTDPTPGIQGKVVPSRHRRERGEACAAKAGLRLLLALALVAFGSAVLAQEAERKFDFDIPPQAAHTALTEFAEQADLTLVFPDEVVREKSANALVGRYTLQEAVDLLLAGTGLTPVFSNDVVLRVSAQARLTTGGTREEGTVESKTGSNLKDAHRNERRSLFARIAAALAGAVLGTAASGEEGASDREARESVILEEVIVTATKRGDQRLLDVPLSLQLLEESTLIDSSLRDIGELISFVPGASEGLSLAVGQRYFQIRGLYPGAGSPMVGYYVDDTPMFGTLYAPLGRVYDMRQVEILRGPQNTLYGNGAMGGVIRYVPNPPAFNELQAGVRVGYSTTEDGGDGRYADVLVNVPLIDDRLAMRVTGSVERLAGWADSLVGVEDFNDGELADVRALLLWEPTDDWRIKLHYSHNRADQDGGGTFLSGLHPGETISLADTGDFGNVDLTVYSATVEYSGWRFADLVSNVAHTKPGDETRLFLEFPPLTKVTAFGGRSIKTRSNETRLVSKGDGPLQWVAGIFVTDTEDEYVSDVAWDPEIPPFFVNASDVTLDERNSLALFGELSYELLDGQLIPTVGIRYSEEDLEGDSVEAAGFTDGESFDTVNFRFNLSWFPGETSHYYLNIAEGFRSGRFNSEIYCPIHNLLLIEGQCELVQETDEVLSYEVGAKYTLLNGRLFIDAAFYWQDWKRTPQHLAIGGLFQAYTVGDSELYGFDFGLQYRPAAIEGLALSLTGNWNSSEFSNVVPIVAATLTPPFTPESIGAESGQRLPFVPAWNATAAVNYVWSVGAGWQGHFNVTLNHLDGQWGQFGTNAVRGDSRSLLRARFGFERERFGIFLFGRNLLDGDAIIYNQQPTGGLPVFTRDAPRQIGLELTFDTH